MQTNGNGSDSKGLAPPYVAFKTLFALWDRMHNEGAPPRIDRSFLTSMSGGYQTQVLNALRYLGLIQGEEGTLAPEMYLLVDPETRKKALTELLIARYPEATRLGDENATHGQLTETFRELYGLAAETQDKAIAFFLAAARYADLPLSPFFKKPRISSGTARKGSRRGARTPVRKAPEPVTPPAPTGKSMFEVELIGGGKVTLLGDFEPFQLEPTERDFVFGLVDTMRAHQAKQPANEVDHQENED